MGISQSMSGTGPKCVLSVELFEFHRSIFGLGKISVLTSGYCEEYLIQVDL